MSGHGLGENGALGLGEDGDEEEDVDEQQHRVHHGRPRSPVPALSQTSLRGREGEGGEGRG